jgi:hypothetical protein
MPTPTYTPLATVTLGTAASSVTFSSIPATYRDLILVVNATTSADGIPSVRFNGDTGSNYLLVGMRGTNTTGSFSGTLTKADLMDNGAETNSPFFVQMQIMDYSATDKHKTSLVRSGTLLNDNGTSGVYASAHRFSSTSAVTSMSVNTAAGNFNAGSTFNLYGVIA